MFCCCRMVRRGWTQIDVPAGWTQIIRGSPSSLSAVAQRTPGGTEAQSVSRFEGGSPAAAFIEGGPIEIEDQEARVCVECLGTGTVGSPYVFGVSPQEGQDGGINRVRHHQSTTREASLAEVNAKMVRLQGSLAALGPDDISERRVLEDEGPCTSHCCTSWATFGRVREVLRAGGEASREGSGSSGRSVEGSDVERGGVGGGEASFGSIPSRSCSSPSSSAANYPRDRRVDSSQESCCPVGRRSEAEPPVSHREDFSGDQI